MKRIYYIIMMMTAWLWGTSCTESPIGQTPVDDVPPPPVTNVRVEPTPGGAIILYDLPNVTDILYVKGEYWFQGEYKVTRASAMNSRMEIDGLGSVAPVEVTLYVVDHSENVSTPERVSFSPEMPPVESIFRSLEVVPAFGGIQIQWDNPTGAEIGFTVFVADSTDTFDDGTIFFSTAKLGEQTFRNLPDFSERRFGVSLLDKWGNTTPVKEWILTPKFEEKISTEHITQQYSFPWDNTSDQGGQVFTLLFDGTKIATGFKSWHTKENEPLNKYGFTSPVMFSIDLNTEVILGRIILWQGRYDESYFLYGHHNPRTFEVWGTKTPDLTQPMEYWKDDWKVDWTKLADCKIVKPSDPGLTVGNRDYKTEDFTAANAGHEFYMPLTPVRYLRFVITSSWTSEKDNVTTLQEIEFWGDDGIDN